MSSSLPTLTDDPVSWNGSSLLSVSQITPPGLLYLFRVSQSMQALVRTGGGGDDRLRHCVLATVFYEASTRTSGSFQAAMQRLGGTFLHVDGQGNSSAAKKKESLSDTIRCLECYADVTVLRHPRKGSVGEVIEKCQKPVLNAGDGVGEHPTQALLDVFTMVDELGVLSTASTTATQRTEPLVMVLMGDLKHGRTVHSLAKLVTATWKSWWGTEAPLVLRYVAPPGLEMPDEIQEACRQNAATGSGKLEQETYSDLKEACVGAHVLYVTRIQRERFESDDEYERVKGVYVVDEALMRTAPDKLVVLHPLPRVDEIHPSVDDDPRAAYFRQMENGMYVRMALLALVLGKP